MCLSQFYLTIKLYLWGQSCQFSALKGHFECVSTKGFLSAFAWTEWLTGTLLETSNPHMKSLFPHWPVYNKTFFAPALPFHQSYSPLIKSSHVGGTVAFERIWNMQQIQTMSWRIRGSENERFWMQICGWMTEQTETEAAINHLCHHIIKLLL